MGHAKLSVVIAIIQAVKRMTLLVLTRFTGGAFGALAVLGLNLDVKLGGLVGHGVVDAGDDIG